jgi:hypothetical protein
MHLWLARGGLTRAIRFATYDWTRELPLSLRVITMIGHGHSRPREMSNLKALVDPRFNEDDVTVLLVKRTAASGRPQAARRPHAAR